MVIIQSPTSVGKHCASCGIDQPFECFSKAGKNKDGLNTYCRKCRSEQNRRWREANPDRLKAYLRQWRADNPDAQRKWRDENREHWRELKRNSYWRAPEKAREIAKRYGAEHPDTTRAGAWNRRARSHGSRGTFTSQEWEELKAKYDYQCLCCHRKEPEIKLTIDHVIPLKQQGSNDIGNIQPLCQGCNTRKGAKSTDYRMEYPEKRAPR